jgi:hypothetical protein
MGGGLLKFKCHPPSLFCANFLVHKEGKHTTLGAPLITDDTANTMSIVTKLAQTLLKQGRLCGWIIMSCVGVTIDGVWIGDLIYCPHILSRLMTTLYRSLTHTDQCPQSTTVSLNYTLQISSLQLSTLANESFLHSLPYRTELGHLKCLQVNSLALTTQKTQPPILL